MCSFFLLLFFLPNRPTHLHEREGDRKRNLFLGIALYVISRFQGCSIWSQVFFIGWDWRKNCGICINSFLTDYVQEQYNQTIRPTGELHLFGACFFCNDDTFRKTPVLLTRTITVSCNKNFRISNHPDFVGILLILLENPESPPIRDLDIPILHTQKAEQSRIWANALFM